MSIHPCHDLAQAVSDRLARPDTASPTIYSQQVWRQSLAHGIPGIALLHIERAAQGLGPWQRARDWVTAAARTPLTAGRDSHPYHGAPALAHALACAAEQRPGTCRKALDALDRQITVDTRRRLDAAHRRLDARHLPALAEFDAIRGLTGYGAYLLRREPDSPLVHALLDYLVRLTKPIPLNGEALPGWWTATGPSGTPHTRFAGGHANNGLAHGIGGVLALLALAALRGITVPGHLHALRTICAWLDRWRTDTDHGPTWPYWITRPELRTDRPGPAGPRRPSWCYGTAGLARAQQLAGRALADTSRQLAAETALIDTLTNTAHLATVTDPSLCHGYAGLAHTAARMAEDALPATRTRLHALIPGLLSAVHPPDADPDTAATTLIDGSASGTGLLEGAAGVALAVLAPSTTTPTASAWDTCLLLA